MKIKSLKGSRLVIGSYPHFDYNASEGGGEASVVEIKEDNIKYLQFSPKDFIIPSLTWKTTRFLFLPLPPGLKITICMDKLEGTINSQSGEILFDFEARFTLTILSIFRFPELLVKTSLTTGKIKSSLHTDKGLVIQKDGRTRLVGVALIPITGNKILDLFLSLPNEALAVLECKIK